MIPPVWFTDVTTLEVVEANRSALSLLGYSREELIGMNARQFVDPQSHRIIDSIREKGEWGDGGTHIFIRRNGSLFLGAVRWHQGMYYEHMCDFWMITEVRELPIEGAVNADLSSLRLVDVR